MRIARQDQHSEIGVHRRARQERRFEETDQRTNLEAPIRGATERPVTEASRASRPLIQTRPVRLRQVLPNQPDRNPERVSKPEARRAPQTSRDRQRARGSSRELERSNHACALVRKPAKSRS